MVVEAEWLVLHQDAVHDLEAPFAVLKLVVRASPQQLRRPFVALRTSIHRMERGASHDERL